MKIRSNILIIFFLLIPLMQPNGLTYITTINNIYTVFKVIDMLIIFMLCIYKKKHSKIFYGIVLYELTYIIIAIINNYAIESSITFFGSITCLLALIEYYCEKDLKSLISALMLHFEILTYVNLITVLMYPEGIYIGYNNYPAWFLGIDNIHIFTLLPGMCISLIYSYINEDKLKFRTIIYIIAALVQIFVRWSATSVVGVLLIIIFLIFYKKIQENNKIFNYRNYLIIILLLFFGIIIFRIQDLFSYLIVNILGKNLTFTGRIYIWDYVIELIKNNPILGYGTLPILNIEFPTYYFNAEHAHNLILNILYNGGIILFVIFIYINIILMKKNVKYKNNIFSSIFSFFIFVFYVITLTEFNNMKFIFILFVFAYNIENFLQLNRKEEKNE